VNPNTTYFLLIFSSRVLIILLVVLLHKLFNTYIDIDETPRRNTAPPQSIQEPCRQLSYRDSNARLHRTIPLGNAYSTDRYIYIYLKYQDAGSWGMSAPPSLLPSFLPSFLLPPARNLLLHPTLPCTIYVSHRLTYYIVPPRLHVRSTKAWRPWGSYFPRFVKTRNHRSSLVGQWTPSATSGRFSAHAMQLPRKRKRKSKCFNFRLP